VADDVLIIIPARMAATRLPGKPLADIAGQPMIVHVLRRAQAAGVGNVAVATDAPAIAEVVEKAGGRAVMTRADHASGSDRIFEALTALDAHKHARTIVNLQGDLPTLDPADLRAAIALLRGVEVGESREMARELCHLVARGAAPLWAEALPGSGRGHGGADCRDRVAELDEGAQATRGDSGKRRLID